jgi:hypothetical protein
VTATRAHFRVITIIILSLEQANLACSRPGTTGNSHFTEHPAAFERREPWGRLHPLAAVPHPAVGTQVTKAASAATEKFHDKVDRKKYIK